MADKKKKNIFARIGATFKGVISELKKVSWPSKEKLKSIAAVVFVVIIFFAIVLYAISEGGHKILDKVGFYDQVDPTEETTLASESAASEETTAASEASESEASETSAETSEATEATETT